MPKYIEIAHSLKNKIIEGEFKEGELLTKSRNISKTYNTSRVTIRKAIQLLIDESLLYTRRGSGTYVRSNIKKGQGECDPDQIAYSGLLLKKGRR